MKAKLHKIVLPAMVTVSLFGITTELQASFIQLGRTNYLQNFDTLNSSGKSKTLPTGWAVFTQDNQINADDGNATQAGAYSYGNIGISDRALGMLIGKGNNPQFFGADFQNAGHGPITQLNISYTGEEWRLGMAGGSPNQLQFQYSLNAGSLNSGTWINVPSLSFMTPNTAGVGAHNGNLAANQVPVSGTISFLNIPTGGTFWIRWQEVVNGTSAGDGLAVDNFSLSAVPEASTYAAAFGALALLGVRFWKRCSVA